MGDRLTSKLRRRRRIEEMSHVIVEIALKCLGRGFDVSSDFRPKHCKGKESLVVINGEKKDLLVPGFGTVNDVSVDVNCDKGDRIRYQSDVLEFTQMSELLNHRSSLAGKIPSGLFNYVFDFNGCSWSEDVSNSKFLAMDGYFISLFDLHIEHKALHLSDHVIKDVPSSWDPAAIARFIERYGTHIIVGLSVGGQDAIYVKQDYSSNLSPSDLKLYLDKLGDQLFTGSCTLSPLRCKRKEQKLKLKVPEAFNVFDQQKNFIQSFKSVSCKDGLTVICMKRGGDTSTGSHCEWLPTVTAVPDVINMRFLPIISLLKGVPGNGFLSHAINLYLRYKPPISDLRYFLDFQTNKVWAPIHNDLPLGPTSIRSSQSPALNFTPLGPKLYVNTTQVTIGLKPITGMRLHLEGKKNDRLAIHMEHLSTTPTFMVAEPDNLKRWRGLDSIENERYHEPVHWKRCSHVCTAPVKYDPQWFDRDTAFVVTGAQLHVSSHDSKNVLHLRLLYSQLRSCIVSRSKWQRGPTGLSQKSGILSTIISTTLSGGQQKEQSPAFVVDSGVFPNGPPVPVGAQKFVKYVDTSNLCKGPQDSPGHWLVTGAKLDLEKGKIKLHVKFSLLVLVS